MKKREGNTWDNLYPISLVQNIFNDTGESLTAILESVNETVNTKSSQTQVNSLETIVNTKASQTNVNNLETTVATVDSQLKDLAINVKDYGAKGNNSADDSSAIQNALDFAHTQSGGTVYIPKGTYLINQGLVIYAQTTLLLEKNTVIKRNANITYMIINGLTDVNGYDGESNITIDGGVWEGNAPNFPTNVTPIAFGHCRNIIIQNLKVRGVYAWHNIELNSTFNGLITNCVLEGMQETASTREIIQLDLAGTGGAFPWYGNYDNTPCKKIIIEKNTLQNGKCAGIGSHSNRPNTTHTDITIRDNYFYNLDEEAIMGDNYEHTLVENNYIDKCGRGIIFEAFENMKCKNITVRDNSITNIDKNTNGRGIAFTGKSDGSAKIIDSLIEGNYIADISKHGLGIDYCDAITVKDNVIKRTHSVGIWSYFSDRTSIIGNKVSESYQSNASETDLDIRINLGSALPYSKSILIVNNRASIRVKNAENTLITGNISNEINEYDNGSITVANNIIATVWTP